MQYHCAGSGWFARNASLVTLNKVLGQPSAANVEKLFLAQISEVVTDGLNPPNHAAAEQLLEPLIGDVVQSESLGTFGAPSNPPAFLLAVKLNGTRAQSWRDSLNKALGKAGEKLATGGFERWRWNTGRVPEFWLASAGDWLFFGQSSEYLPLLAQYVDQVKQQGRPVPPLNSDWLEASVDLANMGSILPQTLLLLKPARIKLNVSGEGDNLRTRAQFVYPESIDWTPASWQIPKELVRSPLTSFTAAQDTGAFLKMNAAFSQFEANPLTNQFYAWGLRGLPFLTYMAWPARNSTNALEFDAPLAEKMFNSELKNLNGTELQWFPAQKALVLANLRVIGPVLEPLQSSGQDFLVLSLLSRSPPFNPAPSSLWSQLSGRTNLVYYDWESTGPRLRQWQILGRMLLLPSRVPTPHLMKFRTVAKLFEDLAQLTGNTVTEITRTAPNELEAVRTGPLGLTGIEMFLLADWLVGWSDHGG